MLALDTKPRAKPAKHRRALTPVVARLSVPPPVLSCPPLLCRHLSPPELPEETTRCVRAYVRVSPRGVYVSVPVDTLSLSPFISLPSPFLYFPPRAGWPIIHRSAALPSLPLSRNSLLSIAPSSSLCPPGQDPNQHHRQVCRRPPRLVPIRPESPEDEAPLDASLPS